MRAFLMHKGLRVAEIEIDRYGTITKTGDIYEPQHMPLGTLPSSEKESAPSRLQRWWAGRSIPLDRDGLESLEIIDKSLSELSLESLGLSLSDCYWISPVGNTFTWEDLNFYRNDFSEELGGLLFTGNIRKDSVDSGYYTFAPDCSTNGTLKKRWAIRDGVRYLIKASSPPYWQQPYNEMIASLLAEKLGISHVPYDVELDGKGKPCSVCPCFTSEDMEFVSADLVRRVHQRESGEAPFEHYVRCCESLGVDCQEDLDRLLVLDYLMINNDRHYNNFGFLRNPETLELYTAPIFDTGASLGFNWATEKIDLADTELCKPFAPSHSEQIKLVSNWDWIDFEKLYNLEEEIWDIFAKGDGTIYEISNERSDAITHLLNERVKSLEKIADRKRKLETDINPEDMKSDGNIR